MKLISAILFLLSTTTLLGQNSYINNLSSFTTRESIVSDEHLAATPAEFQSHPEFGILPYDAPCQDCYELIQERTDTTRKFIINNTNGSRFAVQTALGTLNYKGADNLFYEYNRKLSKISASKYVSDNKVAVASYDLSSKRTTLTTSQNQQISFNQVELIFRSANNTIENFGLANWSNYTVGEDGVRIIDAWPNVDIEMVNTFHGVKTSYIIKQNLNLGVGQLLFIDNYSLPNNYEITLADPNNQLGKVLILNENGTTEFQISEAFGFGSLESNDNVTFFNYEINGDQLSVVVESTFLDDAGNVYPLIIDPTVASSNSISQGLITGSSYNATCSFFNSCDYLINVDPPLNSTLIDITFSFDYNATSGCNRNNGGIRVFYFNGGCVSPGGAAVHFCNNVTGGICALTNISVFSDISPCLSVPACDGDKLTFALQFFRCAGATGPACSNDCIEAASPFSLTVFGATLETLGNTATGNGTQTISPITCSGTTTFDPLANNGVPPYTYSWSTGSGSPTTTVPSYGTGPVTVTVTDNCGVTRTATFLIICPLGVDYTFITANKIGNRAVELAWETIEETDNDFFTVLSSQNGIDFVEAGTLQSKGIGNFNYNFIDNRNPTSSIVYYRLMNTSLSGEVENSEIFKVDFTSDESDIVIVPNPSNGEFHLNYNAPYSGEYTIQILDAFGRVALNKRAELNKGNSYLPFNLSGEKKGVFTITITNKTSTSKQRIVIQ